MSKIVLVVQVVLVSRELAITDSGHMAVVNLHEIFAEVRQALLRPSAEALSQSDQEQQGSDSPRDAKHSKERAQLVSPHGSQDLNEAVKKSPHT